MKETVFFFLQISFCSITTHAHMYTNANTHSRGVAQKRQIVSTSSFQCVFVLNTHTYKEQQTNMFSVCVHMYCEEMCVYTWQRGMVCTRCRQSIYFCVLFLCLCQQIVEGGAAQSSHLFCSSSILRWPDEWLCTCTKENITLILLILLFFFCRCEICRRNA